MAGEVAMPWKECSVVEERLRFVARLLDGEAMTELALAKGQGDRMRRIRKAELARQQRDRL
jgi:hypothetical protein